MACNFRWALTVKTKTRTGIYKMMYLFKSCRKCCGDLIQDGDEWRCFQCGRVYYPNRSPVEPQPGAADLGHVGGERPKVRRSARHLNPVLAATRFSEEQWWAKNETVIYHLDQGKKVREISEIVGQGPRQIRVVRERLRELRTSEPELVGAR
jgi:hypothetical protein